ncbi:MAG: MBL fold metallo-hydrolase [Acidobacteria bacterium]|nr:MBL fold metallo-hydrolase [Acidobacteriota bacterium]
MTNMNVFSSKPRFVCIAAALLSVGVVGSTELVYPQDVQNRGSQNVLELLPVQGNIHMLSGAGGNITVQAGRDGVLLVDSGVAAMSDKVVEAIRTVSKGQVAYIVNTTDRPDHVGGNEHFARTGRPLAIGRAAQASVFIVAFSAILDRMSDRNAKPAIPDKAWPNDTYSVPVKNLSFNGEAIQIFHQPATTDGDSIVLFRRADVISTGDIFDPTSYPVIDLKNGGSLQSVIDGLYRLKQMAIPADHQEGGTMIVPGHGRVCDVADLAVYHHMVTIVRDRLQDMIKRGLTLEQVKAARPTRDYDPIYGRTTGTWTTDMFVEAAYRSLTSKPNPNAGRASN